MTIYVPGKLTFRKDYIGTDDPDAAAYIAAVEAADGEALETDVKVAIHSFVKGCKADGIWAAIKACCILADARTLAGVLVPLVGPAPTRFGTEGGWNYNRGTGLAGNGTNNYLSSNVAANASPITNNHLSIYVSSLPTANFTTIAGSEATYRFSRGNGLILNTQNHSTSSSLGVTPFATGLMGMSRTQQASYEQRSGSASATSSRSQDTTSADTISMFAMGTSFISNARLAFYSIGESLDLALLDARVTALVNAIGAAIP